MSFRLFLALMGLGTFFVGGAWVFVLLRINPLEAGWLGLILFYLTLGGFLTGLFFLGQMGYSFWIRHEQQLLIRQVRLSIRRSVLVACVAILLLALSAQNQLRFLWLVLILVVACTIEYISLRLQQGRRG